MKNAQGKETIKKYSSSISLIAIRKIDVTITSFGYLVLLSNYLFKRPVSNRVQYT